MTTALATTELTADDRVIGAVNVFRHNTDTTVPGLVAG